MGTIKLGDRLTIPGKNVKGEVAFIGETHFSDGIWFGIILDDPVGKHNGTVENKRYFKCPRNHGMFIKATYFEKQCDDINNIIEKPCSLIPKKIKHPDNHKASPKLKTETTLGVSKGAINHKKEPQSENKISQNLAGDNVTNINDENTKLTQITECGDNNNASDEKKFQYVRRYPNYLKASSKISGSHFCLNRTKGNKNDHEIGIGDRVTHDAKNSIFSTTDSHDNPDKDENECRKRLVYPNYLKASSKLVRKHFCVTKNTDTSNDGVTYASEKNTEMQTSKSITDNIENSENPYAYLIKYPYHQKPSSFKGNHSCLTKRVQMNKLNFIQETFNINTELEELRRENEELKNKLKNTEVCLREALSKCNEVQEENKHLKYDNECQRKQIKFQKSHLKLLKMGQSNHFKKADTFGVKRNKYKQKKIADFMETIPIEHSTNVENASDGKFDLEDIKGMTPNQRVVELEEQNRLMILGLLELRDFLKKQGKPQSIEPEPLNFDSCGRFQNRNNKKDTFSESFSKTSVLNLEACTTEESTAQCREYSEILREMTKFNELMKEKRRYLKDWDATNIEAESFENTDSTKMYDLDLASFQAIQNFQSPSTCNNGNEIYANLSKEKPDSEEQNSSTLKKSNIQVMSNTEINPNLYFPNKTPNIHEKVHKHHREEGTSFDLADCNDRSGYGDFTKDPVFEENSHLSNAPLIEQYMLEKQNFEEIENATSRKSDIFPGFPMDLSNHSTDMNIKSSGRCSNRLSKWNRLERKMPVSNELRPDQGIGVNE